MENAMAFDLTDLARKVRAAGRAMGTEGFATMELYRPFHETEPYTSLKLERDISYGPDERNRLDVFSSPNASAKDKRDVLIFVHGGGFVQGDKHTPGSPYNDNVPLWAMRNGLVGVNMTYRLAPQHKWPSGIEDIAGAVDWTRRNIAARGGNPERIFVFGVSAGAMHAGMYVSHSRLVGGPPIAGAILESGIYDFSREATGIEPNERQAQYMGTMDNAILAQRASIDGLVNAKIPVLYVICEYDPPMFEAALSLLMNRYLKQHGAWPNIVRLMGHNHFTGTIALNTPDDYLGRQILSFIENSRS